MTAFERKLVGLTGAAGGIGRALTRALLDGGARVVGVDRDEVAAPEDHPHAFFSYACDVTDHEAFASTCSAIRSDHGTPDIWINNAGIVELGLFEDVSKRVFDDVMAVNATAVVDGTRLWLPAMKERGHGSIVNVASVAGVVPTGAMSSYVASKFAVVGFTRSLQQELTVLGSDVHLMLVCPGFVRTPLIRLGEERGFPKALSGLLSTPDRCAAEILAGLKRRRDFVGPTLNGKLMLAAQRLQPALARAIGRVMLRKNLRQLTGVEPR